MPRSKTEMTSNIEQPDQRPRRSEMKERREKTRRGEAEKTRKTKHSSHAKQQDHRSRSQSEAKKRQKSMGDIEVAVKTSKVDSDSYDSVDHVSPNEKTYATEAELREAKVELFKIKARQTREEEKRRKVEASSQSKELLRMKTEIAQRKINLEKTQEENRAAELAERQKEKASHKKEEKEKESEELSPKPKGAQESLDKIMKNWLCHWFKKGCRHAESCKFVHSSWRVQAQDLVAPSTNTMVVKPPWRK